MTNICAEASTLTKAKKQHSLYKILHVAKKNRKKLSTKQAYFIVRFTCNMIHLLCTL